MVLPWDPVLDAEGGLIVDLIVDFVHEEGDLGGFAKLALCDPLFNVLLADLEEIGAGSASTLLILTDLLDREESLLILPL